MFSIEILLVYAALALVMEIVDSALGMMYGTLLSPLLLAIGVPSIQAIPAILLSQAAGSFTASIMHQKAGNANFKGWTHHTKIVALFVVVGVVATVLGAAVASHVPEFWLKAYIALLVLVMGALTLMQIALPFSWRKMGLVAFVSSFNKSATGGGFGPLASTGKMVAGMESKASVATTTFSKAPLCLVGFFSYAAFNGFPDTGLILFLTGGAVLGSFFGPEICKRVNPRPLRKAAGILAVISGLILIVKLLQR